MRLLRWLLLPPAALVAVILAIANRRTVDFSLDPLPWIIPAPLYAVLFAGFLLCLAIGLIAAWWLGRRWRRLAQQKRQEAAELGRELARLKAQRLNTDTKQLPPVTAA